MPNSAKSERPELTSAKVIVSGGRALKDSEMFEQVIMPLADKLGAAADAGCVPNVYQVADVGLVADLFSAAPKLARTAPASGDTTQKPPASM